MLDLPWWFRVGEATSSDTTQRALLVMKRQESEEGSISWCLQVEPQPTRVNAV